MTTKKRPLRMSVTQAAVLSAFDAALNDRLSAEKFEESLNRGGE